MSEETLTTPSYDLLNKIRELVNEDVVLRKLDEEFGDKINDALNYNEFNVREKIEMNPYFQKEFRLLFHKENIRLDKAKELLDKMIGEKYQQLREGAVTLTKKEIESYYLTSDPEIIRARGGIKKQETRAKYFETVAKSFEQQLWSMKTWQELSKGGW